ncbi:MAG: flagellar biosynthetic protein FliO [Planctomycetales bacterium]|nr:flagellar biosynthetic protein FliO [Planctomycetales bacterium]
MKHGLQLAILLACVCIVSVALGENSASTSVFADATLGTEPLVAIDLTSAEIESVSKATTHRSIPLSPSRAEPEKPSEQFRNPFSLADPATHRIASALSLVVGMILLLMVGARFFSRGKTKSDSTIQVIGRVTVSPKHQLHLVRVYDNTLLLAETPNGLTQLDIRNERGHTGDPVSTDELQQAAPPEDDESQRLLEMIRNSDSWKSPIADSRFADSRLGPLRGSTYA